MTTARLAYREKELRLDVRGHAGSAPAGEDLVCAGVSTLAMTLCECVRHLEAEGKLDGPAEIRAGSGKVSVRCRPGEAWQREARELWKFAETGFCLLAGTYPENVRCETVV